MALQGGFFAFGRRLRYRVILGILGVAFTARFCALRGGGDDNGNISIAMFCGLPLME
jgi:hypothetical protein